MFKSLTHSALLLIAGATFASLPISSATAGQFSDGRTFFDRSPSLVRSATSNLATRFSSTYTFTLTVPVDAGFPLQAVTITQKGDAEMVHFDVGKSVAFAGDRYRAGLSLPLASVGGIEPGNDKQTTIVFDPPVQPGTTVTIALEVKRNPSTSGTYLFSVTAYPIGKKGIGSFLGLGRLSFYDNAR